MGTKYHKDGAEWMPLTDRKLDLRGSLPPRLYTIGKKPMGGPMYLEEDGDIVLPKKVYGNPLSTADRILSTYRDRASSARSTGVLLVGEKGAGKTMLAKILAVKAMEAGMPIISVSEPWHGEEFTKFIQSVEQPCVLLFDEFEKVYSDDSGRKKRGDEEQDVASQQELLQLMDGVVATPKLFVLTSNSKYKIDQHMINRPGRIYYFLEYGGLDKETVLEYANDAMANKANIPELVGLCCMFRAVNFDMLQSIVEECNRYGEPPLKALEMLNVKPSGDCNDEYEITIVQDGKRVEFHGHRNKDTGEVTQFTQTLNPFRNIYFGYQFDRKAGKRVVCEYADISFSPSDLTEADNFAGTYTFKRGGLEMRLKRHVPARSPFTRFVE